MDQYKHSCFIVVLLRCAFQRPADEIKQKRSTTRCTEWGVILLPSHWSAQAKSVFALVCKLQWWIPCIFF